MRGAASLARREGKRPRYVVTRGKEQATGGTGHRVQFDQSRGAEGHQGRVRIGQLWHGNSGAGHRGGRRNHGCAAGSQRHQQDFRSAKNQDQERGHVGFRALRDRQAGSAAVDDRRRVVRSHSVGGQSAYSLRHRRREPQLSASGINGLADGRAAGGGKERQDSESYQRAGAGGKDPGGGGH